MLAYYRSIGFQKFDALIFLDSRYMELVNVVSPVNRSPLEIIPETQHHTLLCDVCVNYDINYEAIMHEKVIIVRHKATRYVSCYCMKSSLRPSALVLDVRTKDVQVCRSKK
jgi:uncharacterized protein YbaR (Trm112 family)